MLWWFFLQKYELAGAQLEIRKPFMLQRFVSVNDSASP